MGVVAFDESCWVWCGGFGFFVVDAGMVFVMNDFVEIEERDGEQYVAFLIPEFAFRFENGFGETIFQWRDDEGFHRCAFQPSVDNGLTGAFFEHSLCDRVVVDESNYPSAVDDSEVDFEDEVLVMAEEFGEVFSLRPELVPILADFVRLLREKSVED